MNALIYKDCRATCTKCDGDGCPTWRYRCEPFQWAVADALEKEEGLTYTLLEARCGWNFARPGYLTRVLGLRSQKNGWRTLKNGTRKFYEPTTKKTISYDNAVRLARALDLDLHEWEI